MSRKIKLSRQTIAIKLEDETNQNVSAWVYNDCLAWHKGISGQWVLTHLATGYKLADYHGKYNQLRELTKDLSLISDWQTTDHVCLTSLAKLTESIIGGYE